MADHKSAIKRIRQNKRRRERNRVRRSRLSTALKKVRAAIEKGNKKDALAALTVAIPLIDRAGHKHLVHPKNASRKVSRLSSQVAALK